MSDDSTAPRWSQLTYTSADSGSGEPGGWGVKSISGSPSEPVRELMLGGAVTNLDLPRALPDYPSQADLDDRPRRLQHVASGGLVTLWHAVAAGSDPAGRPGNVFNHVAHQETPAPRWRAVQLWRSPDWAVPYGPREVSTTIVGDTLRDGEATLRSSVVDFVLADMSRRLCLEWLLAAVADVCGRRATLVCGTDSTDEAAMWIAAVSYLTSPAQARRLAWVTFARAYELHAAHEEGLRLVFVPQQDLDAARALNNPDLVVVDLQEDMSEDDQHWRSATTSFARAPEWQNAMLDVFARGRDQALDILEQVDDLCAPLTDTDAACLRLSWPLWVALLAGGQEKVAFRSERLVECLVELPHSLINQPAIAALLNEAAGDDAVREAILKLEPPRHVRGALEVRAVMGFLTGGWRNGNAPGVRVDYTDEVVKAAGSALSEAVTDLDNADPAIAHLAAALIAFVLYHAIDPPPDDDEISQGERAHHAISKWLADPASPLSDQERHEMREILKIPPRNGAPLEPDALSEARPTATPDPDEQVVIERPIPPPVPIAGAVAPHVVYDDPPPDPAIGEVRSAIADLYRQAAPKSERQIALAESLLLACGVIPHTLNPGDYPAPLGIESATELAEDDKGVLGELCVRWLVRYCALEETRLLGHGVRPVPSTTVTTLAQRHTDVSVQEVQRLYGELDPETQGAFMKHCRTPRASGSAPTLLHAVTSTRHRIGELAQSGGPAFVAPSTQELS